MGTHSGGGIGLSSRVQMGNIGLTAGPPNLILGPGLNLGLGGGASSSGGAKKGGSSGGQSGGNSGGPSEYYTTDNDHRGMGRVDHSSHYQARPSGQGSMSSYDTDSEHSDQHTQNIPESRNRETINGRYQTRSSGQGDVSGVMSENSGETNRSTVTRNSRPRGSVNGTSTGQHGSIPRGQGNASGHKSGNSGPTNRSTRNSRTKGSVNGTSTGHHESIPRGHGNTSGHESGNSEPTNRSTRKSRPLGSVNGNSRSYHETRPTGVCNTFDQCSENTGQASIYMQNGRSQGSGNGGHHDTRPTGVGNMSGHVNDPNHHHGVQGSAAANSKDRRSHYMTESKDISGVASGSSSHFRTDGNCRELGNVITLGGSSALNDHHTMTGRYRTSPDSSANFGSQATGHGSTARNKTSEQPGKFNNSSSHMRRTGMIGDHNLQRHATRTGNDHESEAHRERSTAGFHPHGSTEGGAKSGFGSTYQTSGHMTQASHKGFSSGSRNRDAQSSTSGRGYAWQAKSSDKTAPAKNRDMKQRSYGEKLAQTLSKEIEHIAPERPKEKGEPKSSIPPTREEAKRELKTQMKVMKTKLDFEEKEKSSRYGSGIGSGKSGDGKQGASSKRQEEGDHDTTNDDRPSQKPFGAQGNIHTLGCFQSHGNKRVTTIRGKVHGFAPS